jgi:hypothetical protein
MMHVLDVGILLTMVMVATTIAATPPSGGDSRQTFKVGTATAARGQKVTGVIEVPAGVDPATRIPVAVVHGAKPGPVLALLAGAHGTEYASIIALEQLIALLDPAGISGSVIIVPLENIASFHQKVPHLNPVDGKNMNRMYPGRLDGTQSERAAYVITQQVVDQCDYLIDYHGGDLDENLRTYVYWPVINNEKQDQISREMALAFGFDHIIITTDRPKDPAKSMYLENTASLRGKPSITAEAGYAGTVEPEDVSGLVNGTLSVMRYLKMLPGIPTVIENPVWVERIAQMNSEQTGIFYPLVKPGTYAERGMKVGYVTDYVGKTIYEARAPEAGLVLYVCAVPSMAKGETIAFIGVLRKTGS